MIKIIIKVLKFLLNKIGLDVVRYKKSRSGIQYPNDFSEQNKKICELVKPYTMTSSERVNALIEAVQHVINNNIPGALVECGVWKGGSTMAMAHTLNLMNIADRELYCYDTYTGMSAPSENDIAYNGDDAQKKFKKLKITDDSSNWCYSELEEVQKNILSTGYPQDKIRLVKGKVEDTIPETVPKEIALLRLDTDWYESTKHELTYLFPLLNKNGILIIDDYGHWEGAKKAVDEYFIDNNIKIFLCRIDYTGRIAIKI